MYYTKKTTRYLDKTTCNLTLNGIKKINKRVGSFKDYIYIYI